ncbi:hypothetical protein BDV93DRAFT_529011 [Ceratobasidium sp. AG-I]|nr:hypothetical protein BDV93DRAFT_529011 [Ceratobasidium sp. AG-I]
MFNSSPRSVTDRPKTIIVVFRESSSWLYRWYSWIERGDPYSRRQIVHDVIIDSTTSQSEGRYAQSIISATNTAFKTVVDGFGPEDTICIFACGEQSAEAASQLSHKLHKRLWSSHSSLLETPKSATLKPKSNAIKFVAINYNRKGETPWALLVKTIAKLPASVERVMCTNEVGEEMFACLAKCGSDGALIPKQICRFECGPPWRTNRHWLIKQTSDIVHYQPMHIKNWFDKEPKIRRDWTSHKLTDDKKAAPLTYSFWFDEYRLHDDHIVNILDDDEFDLRYHVWESYSSPGF